MPLDVVLLSLFAKTDCASHSSFELYLMCSGVLRPLLIIHIVDSILHLHGIKIVHFYGQLMSNNFTNDMTINISLFWA